MTKADTTPEKEVAVIMPDVSTSNLCLLALEISRLHCDGILDLTQKWCLQNDEGSTTLPELGDNVDMTTFSQILEMDEDESEREFSKPLVFNFFEQVEETFEKMDTAL